MTVLAPRQRQMLSLVAGGAGRAEIAEVLGVHYQTVKATLTQAYRKLGVTTSAEAVLRGIELGELRADSPDATPTTVRESPDGAIAVQMQTTDGRGHWLVVRADSRSHVFQRLGARDVAGWQILWNHNTQGEFRNDRIQSSPPRRPRAEDRSTGV